MPGGRDDLSGEDLRELRAAYESAEWSCDEICDRFGFSPGALRAFASRRGWKRPPCHYRRGVTPKEIPALRRETARLLWETGETTLRIGRWIGTSENTAHALCTRAFGPRDVRANRRTYFARRNQQILAMREAGVSIAEICDQFWLGRRGVRGALDQARLARAAGQADAGCNIGTLDDHLKADRRLAPTLERHERNERVRHTAITLVAEARGVPQDRILWGTRGKAPVAFARAISMYLVHVEAGYSLTATGMLFGRDRTTVGYGCARVEDRRDDPAFDELVDGLEQSFSAINGTGGHDVIAW